MMLDIGRRNFVAGSMGATSLVLIGPNMHLLAKPLQSEVPAGLREMQSAENIARMLPLSRQQLLYVEEETRKLAHGAILSTSQPDAPPAITPESQRYIASKNLEIAKKVGGVALNATAFSAGLAIGLTSCVPTLGLGCLGAAALVGYSTYSFVNGFAQDRTIERLKSQIGNNISVFNGASNAYRTSESITQHIKSKNIPIIVNLDTPFDPNNSAFVNSINIYHPKLAEKFSSENFLDQFSNSIDINSLGSQSFQDLSQDLLSEQQTIIETSVTEVNKDGRVGLTNQEKSALISAAARVLTPLIARHVGEKEAEIFSLAASSGTILLSTGFTPVGYTLVAMSIAQSLTAARNQNNPFNDYVVSALQSIQVALETISEQLVTLEHRQIEILSVSYEILSEVRDVRIIAMEQAQKVNKKLIKIEQILKTQKLDDYVEIQNERIRQIWFRRNRPEVSSYELDRVEGLITAAIGLKKNYYNGSKEYVPEGASLFEDVYLMLPLSTSQGAIEVRRKPRIGKNELYRIIGMHKALSLFGTGAVEVDESIVPHPKLFSDSVISLCNILAIKKYDPSSVNDYITILTDMAIDARDELNLAASVPSVMRCIDRAQFHVAKYSLDIASSVSLLAANPGSYGPHSDLYRLSPDRYWKRSVDLELWRSRFHLSDHQWLKYDKDNANIDLDAKFAENIHDPRYDHHFVSELMGLEMAGIEEYKAHSGGNNRRRFTTQNGDAVAEDFIGKPHFTFYRSTKISNLPLSPLFGVANFHFNYRAWVTPTKVQTLKNHGKGHFWVGNHRRGEDFEIAFEATFRNYCSVNFPSHTLGEVLGDPRVDDVYGSASQESIDKDFDLRRAAFRKIRTAILDNFFRNVRAKLAKDVRISSKITENLDGHAAAVDVLSKLNNTIVTGDPDKFLANAPPGFAGSVVIERAISFILTPFDGRSVTHSQLESFVTARLNDIPDRRFPFEWDGLAGMLYAYLLWQCFGELDNVRRSLVEIDQRHHCEPYLATALNHLSSVATMT